MPKKEIYNPKPKQVLCKLTNEYCEHASKQSNRPLPKMLNWCHGNCPHIISMPVKRMKKRERIVLGRRVTIPGKLNVRGLR